MRIQAVILAGGLATRLGTLTANVPKALLPIEGYPFIHFQLKWLSQHGIQDVLLCLGHLRNPIQEWVRDGSQYNLHVKYSCEEKLLGTGGAIKNAERLLKDSFFILNGDTYAPINLLEPVQCFLKNDFPGMLTVFKNTTKLHESNVAVQNGRVQKYLRKHNDSTFQYIDYGMQFFKKEVLEQLTKDFPFDLDVLYQELIKKNQLMAYEIFVPFQEIGTPEGLQQFRQYLKTIS